MEYEKIDKVDTLISEYLNPSPLLKAQAKSVSELFSELNSAPPYCHHKIQQWIDQLGLEKLSHSFIVDNCCGEKFLNLCRVEALFRFLIVKGKTVKNDLTNHLLEVFDICLTEIGCDSTFDDKLIKQRNASLILLIVLNELVGRLDKDRCNQATLSFAQIMHHCEHMEAVLYATLCVEKIHFHFFPIRAREIGENLKCLAHFLEHVPTEGLYCPRVVPFRYQVGLCANWLSENQFGEIDSNRKLSLVKLSPDCFSARLDDNVFAPVLSAFPINSRLFYYEVILVTGGEAQIGWCTREGTNFTIDKGLGYDRKSVAFDGYNMTLWHGGELVHFTATNSENQHTTWQAGDVIGCGIDFHKKKFYFYLNGQKLKLKKKLHFSNKAYHAAATLTNHQQCYFNFGQSQFKFKPENIAFQNFFDTSSGDVSCFRLMQTELLEAEQSYWFKRDVTANRFIPSFLDSAQTQFDQWVGNFEESIPKFTNEAYQGVNNVKFDNPVKNDQDFLRLIQSLIRLLGMSDLSEDGDDKTFSNLDTNIEWLSVYFSNIDSTDQIEPKLHKILELLYPYTTISPNYDENVLRQRNLCFVILLLLRKLRVPNEIFISEIENFLFKILNQSRDEWSLIFVLLCLEALYYQTNDREKSIIFKHQKRLESLSEYSISCSNASPLHHQVAFCAQWFLSHVLAVNPSPAHRTTPQSIALLDPQSRTANLKVSTDLLSARNDHCQPKEQNIYQSIRSAFAVLSGVYFYEVTLLTGGSQIIGWSTKETILEKSILGNDCHSIGYGGYRGIYANKQRKSKPFTETWRPGDVIGCLIDAQDAKEFKFTFYHNGKASETIVKSKPSQPKAYFATVSLGVHQQCEFNFGQFPFRFLPTDLARHPDFSDFYTKMSTSNSSSECQFCLINRASVRYVECNHWKLCSSCFVMYDLCPTCL